MPKQHNGYTLFCKSQRTAIKEFLPEKTTTEITSMLANTWRSLDFEEKAKFKSEAEQCRINFSKRDKMSRQEEVKNKTS